MRLIVCFGALLMTLPSVLAQGGGTGAGGGGGPGPSAPGAAQPVSGAAGDWTSLWWIIALVVALVLAAIFFMARRQRP